MNDNPMSNDNTMSFQMGNFAALEYRGFLTKFEPKSIQNDEEYKWYENVLNELFKMGDLTEDMSNVFDLVVDLMKSYELRTLPKVEAASASEVIRFLLEDRGLRQKDLVAVFKTESVVSEMLSGKRKLTLDHVRGLGEFFEVPARLFVTDK